MKQEKVKRFTETLSVVVSFVAAEIKYLNTVIYTVSGSWST